MRFCEVTPMGLHLVYVVRRDGYPWAGKFADIIAINQNLFEVDNSRIRESKIEWTMTDGKIIY